ncbi:MAG: hypothetical protein IPM32_14470 [Ignavibacteriae bacterium]|nr:hypothetical protein [Ignavibacteriota bacterium]
MENEPITLFLNISDEVKDIKNFHEIDQDVLWTFNQIYPNDIKYFRLYNFFDSVQFRESFKKYFQEKFNISITPINFNEIFHILNSVTHAQTNDKS